MGYYGDDPKEPCGLTYPQLGKLPDAQVMAHLAAGHGDAIAVLLDRYSRLVLSIAFKIVHDHGEAEDTAQEIFVELCRTAAQFDPAKGIAKWWIMRTAYRRSLNRRRALKLREMNFQGEIEDFMNLAASEECGAFPKLAAYESQRLVRQILRKLDVAQRHILELVYFEGLSLREVADQTGTTLASVRHRYYRAMGKLRELMQEARGVKAQPARKKVLDADA
jgi:RNA polymerase sigma-70 factor (ECF subfamily)